MSIVPKGNDFLPLIDKEEIKKLYKEEKKGLAKIRLQACLFRKEGNTLNYISNKIEYPLTTVGDWLRRINNQGLSRRHSLKQSGRPSRLSTTQKNETIGDIKRAYMLAWKSKCKGITVYRYGSKDSQILNIQKQTTISDDCNNKECNF